MASNSYRLSRFEDRLSKPFQDYLASLEEQIRTLQVAAGVVVPDDPLPHPTGVFPVVLYGTDQDPQITLDPAFVDSVNRQPIVIPGQDGEPGQDSYIPGPKGDKGEPGALGVMVCEEHYHDESVTVIQQGSSTDTSGFLTSASIVDSIADSDTDHAPSRNAVFDALALKADVSSVAPLALFACTTTANSLADNNSAQAIFPSANDTLTVEASTTYFFEALIRITNGTTTHTDAFGFGGTATFTSIGYEAMVNNIPVATISTTAPFRSWQTSAGMTVLNTTGAQATRLAWIHGVIRINGGGTLIPQWQFSAAPGGTNQVEPNTYIWLQKVGANTIASYGPWA